MPESGPPTVLSVAQIAALVCACAGSKIDDTIGVDQTDPKPTPFKSERLDVDASKSRCFSLCME
ncbi:hypothetical protein GCM10008090_06680 [Arenicella chitinivorans]|uniref:Uncharacterized protein n=1 Tax=Arenicella chitinivorans TaxID=1329800 RepID=A0A918RL08_9GAMM|nr:hypothetical protein GCM10008090_06680 [Arenicella chitinivorans]